MAFPESIFVPIGVVSAALIAGAIAYAGFISTKESKVSEFRQVWINGLREEISLYISCTVSLIKHITRESLKTDKPPSSSLLSKLDHSDLYTTLLKAKTSIALRINNKEKEKVNFARNEEFLSLIELTYEKFEAGEFEETYKTINLLTSTSRELLKHEWNRARDGEKRYQEAKAISQWAMGTAGAVLMAILMAVAYESLATAASFTKTSTAIAPVSTENLGTNQFYPVFTGDGRPCIYQASSPLSPINLVKYTIMRVASADSDIANRPLVRSVDPQRVSRIIS